MNKDDMKFTIFAGGCVIIIISLSFFTAKALVDDVDNSNITSNEARLIKEWLEEFPELKTTVDKATADGKITNKEFEEIYHKRNVLFIQSPSRIQ